MDRKRNLVFRFFCFFPERSNESSHDGYHGMEIEHNPCVRTHREIKGSMNTGIAIAMILFGLGLGASPSSAAVLAGVEPDQSVVVDPVEREFDQKLQALRHKQKLEIQHLQSSPDLTPQQRLDKRRQLMATQRKEIQDLEAQYQGKISPEAGQRWRERKANRQKRFEKLKRRQTDTGRGQRSVRPGKAKP